MEIGLDDASKETGKPRDAPSLRTWREFFPRARIYGYYLNDFSFFGQTDTFTFQGSQESRQDLQRFLAAFGNPQFDVIMDDGSHLSSHQQISLAALFPNLTPGGMYVIEDLAWQPYPEEPSTLTLLRGFSEIGSLRSPFLTEEEAAYLESQISRVELYKPNDSEFAIIYKKGHRAETAGSY